MHYINYSSDFRCYATTTTPGEMGCVCRLSRSEEVGKMEKLWVLFSHELNFMQPVKSFLLGQPLMMTIEFGWVVWQQLQRHKVEMVDDLHDAALTQSWHHIDSVTVLAKFCQHSGKLKTFFSVNIFWCLTWNRGSYIKSGNSKFDVLGGDIREVWVYFFYKLKIAVEWLATHVLPGVVVRISTSLTSL